MELEIENIGVIRSSKKQRKQKKVPQRGLGVAQLEKMRLEEQQKKTDFKSSHPISNNHLISIPDHIIASPNSILRLQNNFDIYNNSVQLGWHQGPKVCCEFNFEKEDCQVVDPGLGFQSNPIWRRSHYHRSPPSMMNVSSTSSSSSTSSLVNLHMELPSNQNNSYAVVPLWPEEELKMVGMKRSYPFSLESDANYHSKFIGRSEESTSFGIHALTTISPNFRGPWSCDSESERKQKKWKKNKKESGNGDFNGDFLTLGPPALTCLPSNNLLQFHNSLSFDFSSLPYQGIIGEDEIGKGVQPFYSFLPAAAITQSTTTCNADFGEHVIDLNLKL